MGGTGWTMLGSLLAASLLVQPVVAATGPSEGQSRIRQVLDDFHAAAAAADEERYFAALADDAVFLGTAPGERWDARQFRAFAHPYFAQGRGWTYTLRPGQRRITVEGSVAWFDEVLDNAKYGECRGSGVLRRDSAGRWKIVQYHLVIPIPNEIAPDVVGMIRELRAAEGGAEP